MYMTNTKFSPNFSSHLLKYGELPSAQEKKEMKDLMALETFHTDFGCVLMRMRPEERKLVTPEGLMKLSRDRFPLTFGYSNYHQQLLIPMILLQIYIYAILIILYNPVNLRARYFPTCLRIYIKIEKEISYTAV